MVVLTNRNFQLTTYFGLLLSKKETKNKENLTYSFRCMNLALCKTHLQRIHLLNIHTEHFNQISTECPDYYLSKIHMGF